MIRLFVMVAAVLLNLSGLQAQLPPDAGDPGRLERTREDLERLLAFYEGVLQSPAYSQRARDLAQDDVEQIRSRLVEGDFRLGDRIVLYVQGEAELPDTIPVQAGPVISLPLFGDVPLQGVLRSEIKDHLTEYLSMFIREPVVRAQGLMRVSIQGAVGQPGFYLLRADMLLSEAVMAAGGPAQNADLEALSIERGPQTLVDGEDLQEALREGLTLDQLNLQAGDQLLMPEQGGGLLGTVGIIAGLLGSLTFLFLR